MSLAHDFWQGSPCEHAAWVGVNAATGLTLEDLGSIITTRRGMGAALQDGGGPHSAILA